jgi:hypothetical protein
MGLFNPSVSNASIPTSNYVQAYFGTTSSWSTASTTFVPGTNSGGNALTIRASNGISLTAGAGSICGVVFTPSSTTAAYHIICSLSMFNSSSTAGVAAEMVNQTGSVVIAGSSGVSSDPNLTISGIFAPGSTSAQTVQIYFATYSGGTASITAAFGANSSIPAEWTIVQIAN